MSIPINCGEAVLQALQKYQVSYSHIAVSEGQNHLTITLGRETDPSNLKQFTSYLAALNLNFKSSFQSRTGLIHLIVY
ncbi:hypothetical protein [Emticicia agri]|uniref:Uncharacterized protein n=1 Tax=Emticicia agri TaxID=2492393 RepID=A0A4Q5LSW5_9BACT|nr:hypothetical protein [Emticicia agri]RYU92698.1 hypothetical protein EWM59_25825 [Emticicia agri]